MPQRVYSDFDAFAASISGADMAMMPLNLQGRTWSHSRLDLDIVDVQAGMPGSGAIVEGSASPDSVALYLPSPGACEYTLNGEHCEADSVIVVLPGSSFHLSTSTAHEWTMLSSQLAALPGSVDHTGRPANAVTGGCWVSAPNPQLAKRFRRLVHQVLASAGACEHFETSPAARNASVEALEIASSVIGAPVPARRQPHGRPRMPRREVVDRCLALLESRQAATVRTDDLCTAAGVSERTVRNVFHEYFGVCPRTFIRLRRMNAVRQALGAAEPDAASVTEVLVQHGEWEFGRFAVMYQKLFRERPSETLRKSPTRATVTFA